MEILNNFLVNISNIEFRDWPAFIEQLLMLIGTFGLIFWAIYYIFSKILFKAGLEVDHGLHRDHALNFTMLWSFVVILLFVSSLWAYILYGNSIDSFEPNILNFWLGLGPILVLYILSVALFFFQYKRIRKLIN